MRFLAHRLHRRRVDTLAHLGVAVEDLEAPAFAHADLDVTAFGRAVAEPRALDAAPDALVLGLLVDVLDGIERLANAAHALAHDLARPSLSPGLRMFRSRMSQPSTPTFSASMSMMPSIANCAWLLPKPRIAPALGLLV